jgi:cyclopropane fatty-acyl-phospholipid synthase-like methyltransferase
MNFLSNHGVNVGSDKPLGKTPLQYNLKVLIGLFVTVFLARYFSEVLAAVLLILDLALWANYWHVHPWTSYLIPEQFQNDFCANGGRWDVLVDLRKDTSKWLVIKNPKFNRFKTRRIPMFVFIEAFRTGDIEVVGDLPDVLNENNEWSYGAMDWNYLHFLIFGYVFDIFVHSRNQDTIQVTEHYNTGNDFFGLFLGPRMLYTSGYYLDYTESLEKAQDQKLEVVARKIMLEKGMKVLDLGCGWGTWTLYTAQKWGTHTSGLSIAKEQIQFAEDRASKNNIKNVEWILKDYRDMPRGPSNRFDRVTCFEMSEHVGVKNYPEFLSLVWDALEDDGIFYLQIAGLREKWQNDDVIWGLWMYRYIFRGADASLSLGWVVGQLERAGFEVGSVENIGHHYVQTIRQWRNNLVKNKAEAIKSYSAEMYRIYDLFLSWAPVIGDRGTSTCWQLVCYKNLDAFRRKRFTGVAPKVYQLSLDFNDLKV